MGVVETAAEDVAKTAVGGAAGSSVLPWLILGAVVVVAGAAIGGYVYGHRAEEVQFNLYKTQQKAAAEQQVAANKEALLKQQQDDAAQMAKLTQSHGVQVNEITQRRDALLNANRDLSRRLWVAVSTDAGQRATVVSQARTGGPVVAGTSEVELPQQLGGWLVDKFTQADKDADLVTSLQQVVVHDREVCNGSIPGVTRTATVQ
jgi:2-keto-3-deoxy-6-phosphogluconate aldolase